MKSLQKLCGAPLLLALIAAWGCKSSETSPEKGPAEQPKQAQRAPQAPQGAYYAGLWKRADTGAVFKVEDEGGVVRGKLQPGTWLWVEEGYEPEEMFERFEFRLERADEGLAGSATFRYGERDYTSAWKVRLVAGALEARVEELELDDSGEVSSRSEVERKFVFEPAVRPAPPTVARGADDGGFQGDLSALVRAPGRLPLGEGVEVGYRIEVETQAAGFSRRHFLAVVGESGGRWQIETNEGLEAYGAQAADSILGLIVRKDGVVESALLGAPGQAGVKVQILAGGQAPAPRTEQVEVEVPAGTFPALLSTLEVGAQVYRTWTGSEGELEGVLLKFEGPSGSSKALEAEPVAESADLGEGVELRRCTYTNGDAFSYSSDPVIRALAGGLARMKSGGVSRAVTKIGSKAEAKLRWD